MKKYIQMLLVVACAVVTSGASFAIQKGSLTKQEAHAEKSGHYTHTFRQGETISFAGDLDENAGHIIEESNQSLSARTSVLVNIRYIEHAKYRIDSSWGNDIHDLVLSMNDPDSDVIFYYVLRCANPTGKFLRGKYQGQWKMTVETGLLTCTNNPASVE